MENKNKNTLLFRWILILFTLIMIGLAIQMGSKTTAPWNKPEKLKGKSGKLKMEREELKVKKEK
jgi:hypothetical protein